MYLSDSLLQGCQDWHKTRTKVKQYGLGSLSKAYARVQNSLQIFVCEAVTTSMAIPEKIIGGGVEDMEFPGELKK